MQETCVLGPLREPVSIFAVFDGHGGDGASKHSVQRLIHHLQQHIAEQLDGLGAPGAATAPADAFIEQALHAAFHQTDRELTDTLAANCGTTATVAVVTRRKIFLAWAGEQCCWALEWLHAQLECGAHAWSALVPAADLHACACTAAAVGQVCCRCRAAGIANAPVLRVYVIALSKVVPFCCASSASSSFCMVAAGWLQCKFACREYAM